MPGVLVTMCVCRRQPFAELLPRARAAGWALADLVRETGCGAGCGLCRPYLRRMLATGEREFNELLTENAGGAARLLRLDLAGRGAKLLFDASDPPAVPAPGHPVAFPRGGYRHGLR